MKIKTGVKPSLPPVPGGTYDYDAVQDAVNYILRQDTPTATKSIDELAREVIRGDWGNGAERKRLLTAAGYDYAAVQARVNELLG